MCWGCWCLVLAAVTVVSTHLDQTQQQNAESKTWGLLCFCSQRNPGPQQSWKGGNTPSSCRNGKRPAFSCCTVFVLFLFLFCYLRAPWKQRVPAPAPSAAGRPQGPRSPRLPHPIPNKGSPRPAVPRAARVPPAARGRRRFSCLDRAQKILLFSTLCRFLSSASG